MVVLDKAGLKITFKMERPIDTPDLLVINMLACNSGTTQLTDFLFQAAVPKVACRDHDATFCITKFLHILFTRLHCFNSRQTFQLQMLSPSSTVLTPSGQVTQVLKVSNINKVSVNTKVFLSIVDRFC